MLVIAEHVVGRAIVQLRQRSAPLGDLRQRLRHVRTLATLQRLMTQPLAERGAHHFGQGLPGEVGHLPRQPVRFGVFQTRQEERERRGLAREPEPDRKRQRQKVRR